ncbi:lysylphosphatidylglycerol synthase transmembrane domain-containing protein [Chitinivibrio alkaliphilus]|uniref:Uncharacterized protein n=1 Tax=Chitinivibrio alkaliphilus ACht1 TaxID=1313304 RepID=U7DAL8_9BACT|nr:lysylphosphatidylglycerol synthase transmembrane domain-containing protein [Chitinivibrio alkaliphilus]ERP31440.1 hypothetical protein CALK_1641 [Chitinivibrio alkaliphilus ACht1]
MTGKTPTLVKLLITITLLAILLGQTSSEDIISPLRGISFLQLLSLIMLVFLMQFLHVVKWYGILRKTALRQVSFARLFCIHFSAFFFQSILPSAASGDIIKGARLAQNETAKIDAATSVLFARAMGFVILAALGALSLILSPDLHRDLPPMAQRIFVLIYPLLGVSILFLFFPLHKKLLPATWVRPQKIIATMQKSLRHYLCCPGILTLTIVLGCSIFLLLVGISFYIFALIGAPMGFLDLLMVLPIITVLTFIPFTINGAGVREYTFLLFFPHLTVSQVMAFAALFYSATLFVALGGGALYLGEILLQRSQRKI